MSVEGDMIRVRTSSGLFLVSRDACEPVQPEIEPGRLVYGWDAAAEGMMTGWYASRSAGGGHNIKEYDNAETELWFKHARPVHRRWDELTEMEIREFGDAIFDGGQQRLLSLPITSLPESRTRKRRRSMRAIIAGGRDYTCQPGDFKRLDELRREYGIDEVVSGCARGADTLGERWAERHGIKIKRFPAEWSKFGRSAGYLRNCKMGRYADMCILFPGGAGTKHMETIATEQGIPVIKIWENQ